MSSGSAKRKRREQRAAGGEDAYQKKQRAYQVRLDEIAEDRRKQEQRIQDLKDFEKRVIHRGHHSGKTHIGLLAVAAALGGIVIARERDHEA